MEATKPIIMIMEGYPPYSQLQAFCIYKVG